MKAVESLERTRQNVESRQGLASPEELREAAQEFEAYMLNMLLSEMRKTVESGGLFDDPSHEGYRALLYDALTRKAAEAGTFGLAEQMLRQWEIQR